MLVGKEELKVDFFWNNEILKDVDTQIPFFWGNEKPFITNLPGHNDAIDLKGKQSRPTSVRPSSSITSCFRKILDASTPL